MNALKSTIKSTRVLAFMAIALGSLLLAGCDSFRETKTPLKADWDKEASAYLNEHLPAMSNLPGAVYEFQNMRMSDGDSRIVVWIDGVMVTEHYANANANMPGSGISITSYQGVKIRWTKAEGYKTEPGPNAKIGWVVARMIKASYEEHWKKYI